MGLMIKNAIVLLDEIEANKAGGMQPYDATVAAGLSRVRPVVLGAATTILGVVPLVQDAFWVSMALVMMFGLLFGTVLTVVLVPAALWLGRDVIERATLVAVLFFVMGSTLFAFYHQAAGVHDQGALAQPRDHPQVVADEQQGVPVAGGELSQQVDDGGHAIVGTDRDEFGRELVTRADIDAPCRQVEGQLVQAPGHGQVRQARAVRAERRVDDPLQHDRGIPPDLDYGALVGLRTEAREKLAYVRPATVGQATRLAGVNPADISVLLVHLKRLESSGDGTEAGS